MTCLKINLGSIMVDFGTRRKKSSYSQLTKVEIDSLEAHVVARLEAPPLCATD